MSTTERTGPTTGPEDTLRRERGTDRVPRVRDDATWRGVVVELTRAGDGSRDDFRRDEIEGFIVEHYARCYAARVERFLPVLLGLRRGARVVGAIGARDGTSPLYVERYLDTPIERALSLRSGSVVQRNDLVEVGNLAGCEAGAGRVLVTTLAAWIHARGIPWAVFTGTTALRNGFQRLGVALLDLGPADPSRLGDERAAWGSYYDTDPRVTAVSVAETLRAAERDPRLAGDLVGVRAQAAFAGRAA